MFGIVVAEVFAILGESLLPVLAIPQDRRLVGLKGIVWYGSFLKTDVSDFITWVSKDGGASQDWVALPPNKQLRLLQKRVCVL